MFELDVEALFATESPRLTANAANLANLVPEGFQQLATVARLAISQQGEAADNEVQSSDPAQDPDRWNWPNSPAMNSTEVDTFVGRLVQFTDRGLIVPVAESLADKLVRRDREGDDRLTCMECVYLQGFNQWRCANWQHANVAREGLARDLVLKLQRCDGFVPTGTHPLNTPRFAQGSALNINEPIKPI